MRYSQGDLTDIHRKVLRCLRLGAVGDHAEGKLNLQFANKCVLPRDSG